MKMATMKVKIELLEEMLGTSSANPDIHREFIASKGPNAQTMEEEVAAIGVEEATEKAMTIFPKFEDGRPFMWDYQMKGAFKDACGMLYRAKWSVSAGIKAYKKIIDGLVFVAPRKIAIVFDGEMGDCQRPLRASTPQGERNTLASSETVP